MCGLVAAGKTTLARQLAAELPAVRLSRDEWMLRLFGGRFDDPAYVERLAPCTALMWDVALEIVGSGSSVILDWNFWSRDRRADARHRAGAAEVGIVLHWLDLPVDEAVQRARLRLNARPADAHEIDEAGVRHFATIFEPPADDEGILVKRHRRPIPRHVEDTPEAPIGAPRTSYDSWIGAFDIRLPRSGRLALGELRRGRH
ncbi:MAG: AAA family ATPase [Microthrixaceae bacterium]